MLALRLVSELVWIRGITARCESRGRKAFEVQRDQEHLSLLAALLSSATSPQPLLSALVLPQGLPAEIFSKVLKVLDELLTSCIHPGLTFPPRGRQ